MQGVQGKPGFNKMKQLPFMGIVCIVMLVIVYRTTNYQYQQTEVQWLQKIFESHDFLWSFMQT